MGWLIVAVASLMFAPDSAPKPNPAAPADTVFVVIYRHIDAGQPIPIVVDDSVHVYEARP